MCRYWQIWTAFAGTVVVCVFLSPWVYGVNYWRYSESNIIAHYRFEYPSNKFLDSAGKNDWDAATGTNATSKSGEFEGERKLANFHWTDSDTFVLYDPNKSADFSLNGGSDTNDFTLMVRCDVDNISTRT